MNNLKQPKSLQPEGSNGFGNSSPSYRPASRRLSDLTDQDCWGPIGAWSGPSEMIDTGRTVDYDQIEPSRRFDDSMPEDFPGQTHPTSSGNFLVFSGYSPAGSLAQTGQSEIVNQIRQLDIQAEVINRAIQIYYRTMTQIQTTEAALARPKAEPGSSPGNPVGRIKSIKGSRKIQLIFYCIFTAYLELDAAVDPCYAAGLIQLPVNEIDQALAEFSPSGVNSIEPEKFVPFYVHSINEQIKARGQSLNESVVVEKVREIIRVCRSTEAGQEGIENTSSKIVAIVALYFYLNDISGSDIARDTSLFEHASYMSWACIRRYHRDIAGYYNYNEDHTKPPKMDWLL